MLKVIWNDGVVLHHVISVEFEDNFHHPMVVIRFDPDSEEYDLHTNGCYIEFLEALDCWFTVEVDDDGKDD